MITIDGRELDTVLRGAESVLRDALLLMGMLRLGKKYDEAELRQMIDNAKQSLTSCVSLRHTVICSEMAPGVQASKEVH